MFFIYSLLYWLIMKGHISMEDSVKMTMVSVDCVKENWITVDYVDCMIDSNENVAANWRIINYAIDAYVRLIFYVDIVKRVCLIDAAV